MTVWVFGASYAKDYGFKDQWMAKLARDLNTKLVCYALDGCSLDYAYQKFNNVRSQIKENDVVVVTLTTHVKRWFFKYKPEQNIVIHYDENTTPTNFKFTTVTKNPKESEALAAYYESLNNPEVYEDYTLNFFYNLEYLTKKLNLHTVIITSYYDTEIWLKDKKELFSSLNFSIDKLLDVSLLEYTKRYFIDMEHGTITDMRVNHLTKSNHEILANKILDNIKNKTPIDLTKGFVKHILDENSMKDPAFIHAELFGGIAFKK